MGVWMRSEVGTPPLTVIEVESRTGVINQVHYPYMRFDSVIRHYL